MSRLMDRHSSKTGRNIIIGQTHAEICKSRRTEHDPRPRGEGGEEGVVARVASARSKRERERERIEIGAMEFSTSLLDDIRVAYQRSKLLSTRRELIQPPWRNVLVLLESMNVIKTYRGI